MLDFFSGKDYIRLHNKFGPCHDRSSVRQVPNTMLSGLLGVQRDAEKPTNGGPMVKGEKTLHRSDKFMRGR
jgi:hypothetical protein